MKRILAIVGLILAVGLVAGCAAKLSDKFDEKTVVSQAQEIVMLFSDGKYADVTAKVREDLRESLSEEVLSSAAQKLLTDAGAFSEFGKSSVSGTKDKTTKEDYAVVVQQAKYANKTCVYTIAVDVNGNVVGFFIK
jgi:outer membrane lipopolysaccharide assembly protein LptE/RlpB